MAELTSRQRKELTLGWALALLFAVFGVGALGWSALRYQETSRFLERAVAGRGEVVRIEHIRPETGSNEAAKPYPVVRFVGPDGEEIEITGKTYLIGTQYQVGQRIDVLYDADSKDLRINTWTDLWFFTTLAAVIGLGALTIPPFTMWRAMKELRSASAPGGPRPEKPGPTR